MTHDLTHIFSEKRLTHEPAPSTLSNGFDTCVQDNLIGLISINICQWIMKCYFISPPLGRRGVGGVSAGHWPGFRHQEGVRPDTQGTSYDRNVAALQAEFPSATGEWNVGFRFRGLLDYHG